MKKTIIALALAAFVFAAAVPVVFAQDDGIVEGSWGWVKSQYRDRK